MPTNLTDMLNHFGITFVTEGEHHHAREGWLQVDCPYCSRGTSRYRMGISITSFGCNCYACGPHSFIEAVSELAGRPIKEIAREARGLTRENVVPRIKTSGRLKLPIGLRDLDRAHKNYLSGRGFQPNMVAKTWGLRAISIAPRLQWRIWAPLFLDNRIVTWTTRAIGNTTRRYINADPSEEALPIKSLLYGEWLANKKGVIVVEGPADCWSIGPGAVAVMGVGFSTTQVNRLSRYAKRVICFDAEPAAQQRAEELADALSVFDGVTTIACLEHGDPGSADRRDKRRLRAMIA